ncbi:alkyl/aryl-sulfatase [Hungatella hathewayi]
MKKMKSLTAGTPSLLTSAQNHYEKIRIGDDPEYELALSGKCLCGCSDIVISNVWNQDAYRFLKQDYPDNFDDSNERFAAVHPSLWSNGRNNQINGIFEVIKDSIYQVRGYDMANISFVKTDNGWLVLDTLMSEECTYAALELAEKYFATLGTSFKLQGNIKGVIISHSHVDHFGGVKAVCSYNLAGSNAVNRSYSYEELTKNCPIYAPSGFTEASVSENAYAGNAMGRRASYQYGSFVKPDEKHPDAEENWRGSISIGIGQGQSTGKVGFLKPTNIIDENTPPITIDGLEIDYQLTPGTEAPAEMNHYFPRYKALWMAENCAGTLHNLYTLRGAQVRDGNAWAKYLVETAERYGDKAEVIFQAHNWPHWKNETEPLSLKDFLLETASIYKFINDQTLLYLNQGFKMEEAAQKLRLPYALEHNWNLKPYYGTPSHDAKAVYQKYLGWYDANPIHLNPLSPEERARAMAGYLTRSLNGESLKESLEHDLDEGKYRTVTDFAYQMYLAGGAGDCNAGHAKELCAEALRQLAYTSESGPWRNCYLAGAWELEHGKERIHASMGTDLISNMEPYMLLDYIGILYDGDKSVEYDEMGHRRNDLEFIMDITEGNKMTRFHIYIRNGAILYYQYKPEELSKPLSGEICHFSLGKEELIQLLAPPSIGQKTLDERIQALKMESSGKSFLNLIFYNLVNLKNDRFQTFDIVTPHDREFLTESGKKVDLREETKACIRMLEGHLKSIADFGDYDLLAFDKEGMNEWLETDGFHSILVKEAQVVEDTNFFAPAPVTKSKDWQNNLGIGPDGFFCKYEYIQVLESCYRFLAEPFLMGADHVHKDDHFPEKNMYLKKAILLLEPYLNRYRQNFHYDLIIENDQMRLQGSDAKAWDELKGKIFPDFNSRFFHEIPQLPQDGIVYGRQLAYTLYLLYRELYCQYVEGGIPASEKERKAVIKEHRKPHYKKEA